MSQKISLLYSRFSRFSCKKTFAFLFSILFSLICLTQLSAATTAWNGLAGDGLWNTAGNWTAGVPLAGDTVIFTGTVPVTVQLSSDVQVDVFNTSTENNSLITIDTNGYTLNVSNFNINYATGDGTSDTNLLIKGSGKISADWFDFPNKWTHKVTVDTNTTLEVKKKFFANMVDGGQMSIEGNGTLFLPASGGNVDYGPPHVYYASTLTIKPYGEPSDYYVSQKVSAGLTASLTQAVFHCTRGDTIVSSMKNVTFPCKVTTVGSATYTFNGFTVGNGTDINIVVPGNSFFVTADLVLTSGTLSDGDGVTITVYTPDNYNIGNGSKMELAIIEYIAGKTRWTGAVSTAWNHPGNWTAGVPLDDSDVTIHSGVTNFPNIDSDSVKLKSLTITSNAQVTQTGGSLVLDDLICTGNSKFVGSGGVVRFGNTLATATASWKAQYPSNSLFYEIEIPTGKTLKLESDIKVTNNWTNNNATGGLTAGLSTVDFSGTGSKTITGSQTFGDVLISGNATFSAANTFGNTTILGNATFSDSNTFLDFKCVTSGSVLTFGDGKTQTVNGQFVIAGSDAGRIRLLSTTAGTQWTLDTNGTRTVSYAYVKDSLSVFDSILTSNSSSGGNNTHWILSGQEYTWTGLTSTDWTDSRNWVDEYGTEAEYPGSSPEDSAIVKDIGVTGNYPVLSSAIEIKSLSILEKDYVSVELNSANDLVLSSTTPLLNEGKIKYSSSGRITDGPNTINDDANEGTVEYQTATGNISNVSYFNLNVSSGVWSALNPLTVLGSVKISGGKTTFGTTLSVTSSIDVISGDVLFNNGATGTQTKAHTASFTTAGNVSFGNNATDSFVLDDGATLTLPSTLGSLTFAGSVRASAGINLSKDASILDDTVFASNLTITDDVTISGAHTFTTSGTIVGNAKRITLEEGNFINVGAVSSLSVSFKDSAAAINQTFSPNDVSAYTDININKTQGGNFNVDKTLNATSLVTSVSATNISFASSVKITNDVTFNNTGDVTFKGEVYSNSVLVTGKGFINGGVVKTNSNQEYKDSVTLGASTTLTTTNSPITFNKTIDSDSVTFKTLTINTGTGDTNFVGKIGSTQRLDSFSITSENITVNESIHSGDFSVINSGLFLTKGNGDLTLEGDFSQTGTGLNQIAGDIIVSSAASIKFSKDVFLFTDVTDGATDKSCTLGGGTGDFSVDEDLHIACIKGKSIFLNSPLKAQNIVFYSGSLTLGENVNISATKDLVLLKGNSSFMYKDEDTDLQYLFGYNNSVPARTGVAPSVLSFPSTYPNGNVLDTTVFNAEIIGSSLDGKNISVGQNFYDNGVDLIATSEWNLTLKSTESSLSAFAESYNCTVAFSHANYNVAAAEKCRDKGNNTKWDFSRAEILDNDFSKAKNEAGSGTYTVYDDVIRLEFTKEIENTNNEINNAMKNISYSDGSFEGSFTDSDCTISTDGKGNLKSFYIRAAKTWNTDATGLSAGNAKSTDRGRVGKPAQHKTVVPYVDLPKALNTAYAVLRDTSKNRITHYKYTKVQDRASPVLIAAYTGQELHTSPDGTADNTNFTLDAQRPYDAHNFIEFQYSEPVNIGNLLSTAGDLNVKAENNFSDATEHGGAISENGAGLKVLGFADIASGSLVTENKSTLAFDNTVHALYRSFTNAPGDLESVQTHSIRIGIASFVSGTIKSSGKSYYSFEGYISSASQISGEVKSLQNAFITDTTKNSLDSFATSNATQNHKLPTINVSRPVSDLTLYGPWDVTPPSFAPYRAIDATWENQAVPEENEIIGTAPTGVLFLDRIEFHMFDNKPSYNATDTYTWFSKIGWCNGNNFSSVAGKAADIFGGSNPFARNARKTSGGIRYSSLYNAASAFEYATTGLYYPFATTDAIPGAISTLFMAAGGGGNTPDGADGLHFGLDLTDHHYYSLKQMFKIKFDANACCITDLAGNRITTSYNLSSVDRAPPQFNITIAPLVDSSNALVKKLLLVFTKNVNTGKLNWIEDDGTRRELTALEKIPESLRIVDVNGTYPLPSGIDIDKTRPAEKVFSNEKTTGLIVYLTRPVVLSDIKNCLVSVYVENTATDPVTGITGSYVSYIQDNRGNYTSAGDAHALSDFAVNAVSPLYAYDNRLTDDGEDITRGLYSDGSWAVHDWNAEQQNYGTLSVNHNILLATKLYDGTPESTDGLPDKVYVYSDNSPDANSVSSDYNKSSGFDLRVWLPNVEVSGTYPVFKNLASINNSGFNTLSESTNPDSLNLSLLNFMLPVKDDSSYSHWKAGDQISFLFGLMNADGTPVTIMHNPVFSGTQQGVGTYTGVKYPLYALRLKESGTITSLDLWSLKLKDITKQRGGVTILNNVINVGVKENVVVEVDMPSSGNLNVIVMTLDGSIVKYLQHGRTTSGLHYYRWDGTNKSGDSVARGLYFVRVVGPNIDETRKVMCVKN